MSIHYHSLFIALATKKVYDNSIRKNSSPTLLEVRFAMFGYVLPLKSEMKVKEFECYRANYCGLCKQLQQDYGFFSRFFLNYDLVLLSLLSDALSDTPGEMRFEGCFANPISKRCTCHNTPGLTLSSSGLLLLTYYKFCDNILDENIFKKNGYRFLKLFFKPLFKRAKKKYPQVDAVLKEQMNQQAKLEKENCADIDIAAEPTGKMCHILFSIAAENSPQQDIVARMGLFIGQIVYLLDAAEDYEEDLEHGRYNIFLQMNLTKEQAITLAQQRCYMAAGEIALCYNLLDIKQHKEILDNIFFLGLPAGIQQAGIKRNEGLKKHG